MTGQNSKGRTLNYQRQVFGALGYRAAAMVASFVSIPLMITYLGQEQFGVWSTLLTVISWIVFFDLGIGNGLRNKVAEALAKNKIDEASKYIGSAYTLLGSVALSLWLAFTVLAYWIPWQDVFNTRAVAEVVLRETILITIFFVALNFWVSLITALLSAVQLTSITALGQLVTNLIALTLTFIISRETESSIRSLALVHGTALISANIALSIWYYRTHPELRPRIYLERNHITPLLGIGIPFFVIQLAVLIIFTTDKVLIAQLFGPEHVAQYEVVLKLFSVITFGHTLITTPLWSAYTDAYHRQDIKWIREMLNSQITIFLGVMLSIVLLAMVSPTIISAWISSNFVIPKKLVIAVSLFVLVSTWNNVFAIFLNGIGRIRVQLYTAVIAMIANVPLSILLAKKTNLGISAVVIGTTCSLLIASVALPVQVHQILKMEKISAGHDA